MDEVSLYKKHFEFHSNLDYLITNNLSRIKDKQANTFRFYLY